MRGGRCPPAARRPHTRIVAVRPGDRRDVSGGLLRLPLLRPREGGSRLRIERSLQRYGFAGAPLQVTSDPARLHMYLHYKCMYPFVSVLVF